VIQFNVEYEYSGRTETIGVLTRTPQRRKQEPQR